MHSLIGGLVEKLGDNKVMIRQLALQGLKGVGRIMKISVLLQVLVGYLSSPKWHVREEVLNYIIITFLDKSPNQATLLREVDYTLLLSNIIKLLNDDKPKVVQIAYEACATIALCGNCPRILGILHELVDKDTFVQLRERIEANDVPIVSPDGVLEFPHIANELTTQNSFFAGSRPTNSSALPNSV